MKSEIEVGVPSVQCKWSCESKCLTINLAASWQLLIFPRHWSELARPGAQVNCSNTFLDRGQKLARREEGAPAPAWELCLSFAARIGAENEQYEATGWSSLNITPGQSLYRALKGSILLTVMKKENFTWAPVRIILGEQLDSHVTKTNDAKQTAATPMSLSLLLFCFTVQTLHTAILLSLFRLYKLCSFHLVFTSLPTLIAF